LRLVIKGQALSSGRPNIFNAKDGLFDKFTSFIFLLICFKFLKVVTH